MGGDTSAVKKKHDLNPMTDKSEWKTPSMESEGKGDGHQYGRKPRTLEPITPTGIEPTDYDDDETFKLLPGFFAQTKGAFGTFVSSLASNLKLFPLTVFASRKNIPADVRDL